MYQYNQSYRIFFKKLTDLDGKSISSSQLVTTSFHIERDTLKTTSSSFTVLQVPSSIENGDVIGMYDSFGDIIFLGVVSSIEDNTVQANQMLDIFADNWLWHNPRLSTIENTLKSIITTDYQNSNDTLLNTIFGTFDVNTISNTNLQLETRDSRYVTPFSTFLYDIYEKYSIQVLFDVPFEEQTPSINIGIPNYQKLQIGNNVSFLRNFNVNTDIFETNKLVVYSEETGDYRATWFGTTSGITDNPSSLNRLQKIKTNIVFSDDDINILKASSLRNQMYNHEITCELILKNNLIGFKDLHLGQEVDLYYGDDYYNTILTGYSMECDDGKEIETITLKFGLVRTSLTSKLFKRLGYGN